MKNIFLIFFPSNADNSIHGSKIPFYFLILVATIGIIRSCIHIFSPDGGAGSIAGMNLAVDGADEIVFSFALWGSAQLILALLQLVVILRYRSLVTLMWGVQLLEIIGRMLVGWIKSITFAHTPPGAYGNYIYLVLSVLMLVLSFWSGMRSIRKTKDILS